MATVFISVDDMKQSIDKIIASLPSNMEGYMLAYQMYDSNFFKGESVDFARDLCVALKQKFPNNSNALWDKYVGEA